MLHALDEALKALDLGQADAAAVELAKVYARAIDADGPIDVIGPKLLAVLDSLGMTPKARAAQKGGSGDKPASDPLDELRQRRRARRDRAADLDTAAP